MRPYSATRLLSTFALMALAACGGKATSSDAEPQAQPALEAESKAVAQAARGPEAATEAPAGAVGPEAAAEAEADAGATSFAVDPELSSFLGNVDGQAFVPTHNFFLRGTMQVPGEPEVMIFVQTDAPDLCQHLANGTMPKNRTMFAVALMHGADGELAVGGTFLAPGSRGREAKLNADAYFRRLDGDCKVSPDSPDGATAESGRAQLTAYAPGAFASLDYALTLTTGDEVSGSIAANYCDAPALFDDPTPLTVEAEAENCR